MADETTAAVQEGETKDADTQTQEKTIEDRKNEMLDGMFGSSTKTETDEDFEFNEDDETAHAVIEEGDEKVEISKAELERLQSDSKSAKKLKVSGALKKIAKDFPDADHDALINMAKKGANSNALFAAARTQQKMFEKAEERVMTAAKPKLEQFANDLMDEITKNNGRPHTDVVSARVDNLAQLQAEYDLAKEKGNLPLMVNLQTQINEAQRKQTKKE